MQPAAPQTLFNPSPDLPLTLSPVQLGGLILAVTRIGLETPGQVHVGRTLKVGGRPAAALALALSLRHAGIACMHVEAGGCDGWSEMERCRMEKILGSQLGAASQPMPHVNGQ